MTAALMLAGCGSSSPADPATARRLPGQPILMEVLDREQDRQEMREAVGPLYRCLRANARDLGTTSAEPPEALAPSVFGRCQALLEGFAAAYASAGGPPAMKRFEGAVKTRLTPEIIELIGKARAVR